MHTVGCLPLLRELCSRLIERGARRALPGEFTGRAFLSGRLQPEQVEDVLALITSDQDAHARHAHRAHRESAQALTTRLRTEIADLLALIEAGIDFVEEEDIRFISPAQARATLDGLLAAVAQYRRNSRLLPRAGLPHVALVGLPNVGKSTLFNALVGHERAIVSPVLGTTRDVLSAEIVLDGGRLVLQDCAGLGETADELELAAHRAAERVMDQADLVLWVHVANAPWDGRETHVLAHIPAERRLLVWSKSDLAGISITSSTPDGFCHAVATSAATGAGLTDLRASIRLRISHVPRDTGSQLLDEHISAVAVALERARAAVTGAGETIAAPELVSARTTQRSPADRRNR